VAFEPPALGALKRVWKLGLLERGSRAWCRGGRKTKKNAEYVCSSENRCKKPEERRIES
jgi:hypothetical protein